MPTAPGAKPDAVDAHSQQHGAIFERLFQGLGLMRAGQGIAISFAGSEYIISATGATAGRSGTFKGEYDSAKSYTAGDTFIIAADTTIASIAVAAGYYGVPPAGTDSIGTWAGYVPSNPTANQVPQHPLPASGTFYARMIVEYC